MSDLPSGIPGYWMNETSGVLRPAVTAYLNGRPMTGPQIAAMRAYLRQWIDAPGYVGPAVQQLRATVDQITTHAALKKWLDQAEDIGIDPL